MSPGRAFLLRRRWLAALIVAAAIALRLVVPAGFMPMAAGKRLALVLCPGVATAPASMHGMAHNGDAPIGAESRCAFADLALPALGGGDPVPLAAAIAFVLALAPVLRLGPPPREAARRRPPSRAPPLSG